MERRGFLGRLLGGLVAGVVAKAVKTEAAIPAEVVPVEPALVTVAVDKAEVGEDIEIDKAKECGDYSEWTTYSRKAEADEWPCPSCGRPTRTRGAGCWCCQPRQLVYRTTSNVTTPVVGAWDSRSDWISPQEITFKGIPIYASQYAPKVYHGVSFEPEKK